MHIAHPIYESFLLYISELLPFYLDFDITTFRKIVPLSFPDFNLSRQRVSLIFSLLLTLTRHCIRQKLRKQK